MKSPGAISHKIRQLKYRAYKQVASEHLKVKPANCIHNLEVVMESGLSVRLCNKFPNTICDEQHHNGKERALNCNVFEPTLTKKEIKESTADFFLNSKLSEIARDYPDIAALMWVVQDEQGNQPEEQDLDEVDALSLQKLIDTAMKETTDEYPIIEGDGINTPFQVVQAARVEPKREPESPEPVLEVAEALEPEETLEYVGEDAFFSKPLNEFPHNPDLDISVFRKIPFFASIVASLHLLYLKIFMFR